MNIRQIEAFKAIMELGSFTRAGERLGLSQPAVSKLVLLLERKCGFGLFHRQRNGVIPTAEAQMLYAEVERVFLGVDSIQAHARAIQRLDYGEIRLVAFPSLATRILPPILAEFLEARPGLRIEMSSRNSWLLVERIATQAVDVGFGMFAADRPGVRFEKLCTMRAVCALPPGHRLAGLDVVHATDLTGERFVGMVEEDRAQLQVDKAFAETGARPNTVLTAQLTEACCSFVAAGVGVSVVDPLSTEGFASGQLVVRPFRPAVDYDIWVALPSFRDAALGTRALVAHVRAGLTRKLAAMATAIGEPAI
ncbi:LysR family transcriptional regulator [Bosea sp. 2KB_26]|uniref:LysR family transcriptional regulator n=1 Tax=Bosea sp. 2KB_26 TaxID=3237475 RepID=UPI003F914262